MRRSDKLKLADRLFSARIRSRGICQAQGFTDRAGGVECWGPLECAHVIRRWKRNAVRWDDDNAACLCMRHHLYFTGNRTEEDRFHSWLLSPERFSELERRANEVFNRADLDAIISRLRGGATV